MSITRKKILNHRQLKMLGEHKYYAEDSSLLDPSFQLYWNSVVELMPMWVAPNLITLTGLIINVVTTLFVMWYSPDCMSEVSISSSFSTFWWFYFTHNLDCNLALECVDSVLSVVTLSPISEVSLLHDFVRNCLGKAQ